MVDPPDIASQIDERWMPEWIDLGITEFALYLTKWAAFRRYEDDHPQEEHAKDA